MGEWRVLVAETLTGAIVSDVLPIAQPSFERTLSKAGSWGVKVSLYDRANSTVDFHSYTRSGKYSWIVAYDNHITQAGPVWTYQFSDTDGTLSLAGSNIRSLFDKRVLRNPNGSASDPIPAIVNPSEDLRYTGLSLRGILRQLVADNMAQPGFSLPIDLPSAESGQAEREYFAYELATVGDRMDKLAEVIDGPECDFEPYFLPGQNAIRWRMNIGTPLLGDQQSTAVWDYGAALETVDIDVNGSTSPAARVWVKGEGSEREMLTGFAEDTTLVGEGFPPLDYVDGEHTTANQQDTLESYADNDLATFRTAVEKWTCDVRIDGGPFRNGVEASPALGRWALGDAPRFFLDEHPWLPAGAYRRRILGYSSKDEEHVSLALDEAAETTI